MYYVLQCTRPAANISSLKINFDKTQVVWIGSKKYSTSTIKTKWKLSWGAKKFKVLGIIFTIDLEQMIKENYATTTFGKYD